MKKYHVTLKGLNPLLMHNDNIAFSEALAAWRRDPANRDKSVAGDDRSPAWTWIGSLYHNRKVLGVPSDCIMTMLREAGASVFKTGRKTFKTDTQSGLFINDEQFDLLIDGETVPVAEIEKLIGEEDFSVHLETVKKLGFELLIKRARIGQAKHVRVRPMFRDWVLVGSLTVIDESQSGLTRDVLQQIFTIGGVTKGLGDWRPSSRKAGSFGTFEAAVVNT